MDQHTEDEDNFTLPALNPLIKLFKTSPDHDGTPRWTLHLPASNQYYQIGWIEFECLARFHQHKTAQQLQNAVNSQTTLDIDLHDIKSLILFLDQNGLLTLGQQQTIKPETPQPLWKRMIHGYLYFTLPLFKPGQFLKTTLPYVEPFLSKKFMTAVIGVLIFMIFLTLQRFDEFTHTFLEMFSVKGAIITFFVFSGIKIIHELAHAYTATKYGINVPHMGVAFIIMYPVLYTETTGSWQLSSVRERMAIGLAGIMAELVLATIFLILWHMLPPGMGQSISFSVVTISLIGSLLINLNPLMRFDGYFVLSDALGIENLHARAMALTRWKIRRILFGLNHPPPDDFTPGRQKFMILFGLIILIYRFFLFLGIALLVYYVFFKPLGLIMMMLELFWFIVLPVWGEVKSWWAMRAEIIQTRRSKISFVLTAGFIIFLLLPIHNSISVSGVSHQSDYRSIYASAPSRIQALHVRNTQSVTEGETLLVLQSDILEQDLKIAETKFNHLQRQKRREQTDITLYRERRGSLDDEILEAGQALNSLKKQKELLIVKAPFDGVIRDLLPDIHENRAVSPQELLFTVIGTDETALTAYVGENQLSRIKVGNSAQFRPDSAVFMHHDFVIKSIDETNATTILWQELASIYGGDIPATTKGEHVSSLEPIYTIRLKLLKDNNINHHKTNFVERGKVRIRAERESALASLFQRFIALIIRESSLN